MNLLDPNGSHVTIAWLGYHTPGLLDAPLSGRAHESAPLLRQPWHGLDLPDAVNTTVVGHSYGSLVSATALREGFTGVDNFVVIGSPGLQAQDLGALDLAEGVRFFAGRAPFDPVSLTESLGRDPSDPRFDGIRFDTGSDVTGHSDYTATGSESLSNLAYIALGDYEQVTTIDPSTGAVVIGAVDDAHGVLVEGPLDALHWLDERFDDGVNGIVDGVQHLPLGPLQGPIDDLQEAFEAVDRYGDSLMDLIQRVTSPDLWGDLLGDWIAADGPGRLAEYVVDNGSGAVDTALDAGEAIIDTGVDLAGGAVELADDAVDAGADLAGDAVELADDVAERVWDNTVGRLPWP